MLTPEELTKASDRLTDIYSQLEKEIIGEMAAKIKALGSPDYIDYLARAYKDAGLFQNDVTRLIEKYDPIVQKEIKDSFEKYIEKSVKVDNEIIKKAGLTPALANEQILLTELNKTANTLRNLTLTTATTSQQQFIKQATQAYIRVSTGAFNYNRALVLSINDLARQGIYTVEYTGSGKVVKRTIEGAVRANIITGINQTATAITADNCDKLNIDLVEVSAHSGARPTHAEWQGKIYSLSGKTAGYPPFSLCHPGEADGIGGVNCRHSYYPYLGGERMYSDKELSHLDDEKYKYNGKTLTQYQAEQQQRALERSVRRYKREEYAMSKAGLSTTEASAKVKEAQGRVRDFTKQTGLRRDYNREKIGM